MENREQWFYNQIRKEKYLYHGTVLCFANAILQNGIDPYINKHTELDFGNGFYCSDILAARQLAMRKHDEMLSAGYDEQLIVPVILKLRLDDKKIQTNCKILSFKRKSLSWFRFIFLTRLHIKDSSYDFVFGPMADGNIDNIMDLYRQHPNIICKIYIYFHFGWFKYFRHNQLTAKTPKACECIQLMDILKI